MTFLDRCADIRYMRGIPTVAKSLSIIPIVAGTEVVGISAVVHGFVNQFVVFGDRSGRTPPNMGCRHDHYEWISIIDWFSPKVNDLPGPVR